MEDRAVWSQTVFLSVVIPAYNEERRLPHTLEAVLAWLRRQTFTWEVAVVDDGSRDGTAAYIRTVIQREPRVRLLQYGKNRGKGYAVRYGMLHVKGQYRLFMDADNSTAIDHFEKFLPHLQGQHDIAIGSRDVKGAVIPIHQPWWRELLGDLGNVWIQAWAVPGIRDTQAGFKVFTQRAVEAVFPFLTIDGWGFDIEALAAARHKGFKTVELPIRWLNDPDSKVNKSAYLEVLQEVVRIRINIWRGVYDEPPTTPH